MRLSLLLLLLVALVCAASLVCASPAPAAASSLDSGVSVGREQAYLAHRARTTHRTRKEPKHEPEPAPVAQKPLSAGAQLDWHKSVYQGVDRAESVAADQPTQIKLAFIPDGMSVQFATATQQTSPPSVRYGLSPDSLSSTAASGEESTYGTLWFYTALMQNLHASTRYYYQVGGSPTVSSFVTAQAAGDDAGFNVIVVGDMGLDNSANTMMQMNRELNSTDWFLHIGDLSYADDFYLRPNDTYEGSWNKWQDLMEPITSVSAYMSLPGNHEVTCMEVTPFLCPAHQKNMTAYRNRFRMPWRESGGVENLWYSYDYGLVHFIQINTETDYPNSPMGPGTYFNAGPFGDQLTWLKADLEKFAARRSVTPWLVVSGHRPLYSSGHEEAAVIAAFEALFLQYDVDIYFAGHVHWYERTWPLTKGGVVSQQGYNQPVGPVYIINGAAGNVEGLTPPSTPKPYTATIDDTEYGFGRLTVFNATTVQWQYYRATDASIADDITIYKKH